MNKRTPAFFALKGKVIGNSYCVEEKKFLKVMKISPKYNHAIIPYKARLYRIFQSKLSVLITPKPC